jgi:ABC-2 type transport system ATP-binding protein
VSVHVDRGTAALVEAVRRLDAAGVEADELEIRKPTLDDVFLKLTGQRVEVEEEVAS